MANPEMVKKMLFWLSTVLQDKTITPEFIKTYQEMLKDVQDVQLESATIECLKKCRFFPTIAEIREKCEKDNPDAVLSEIFFDLIDGYYKDGHLAYPDETCKKAISAVGGLKELANMKNKDLQFIKKDFINYYRDYEKINKSNKLLKDNFNEEKLIIDRPYIP